MIKQVTISVLPSEAAEDTFKRYIAEEAGVDKKRISEIGRAHV